jgi:hypothetical protein
LDEPARARQLADAFTLRYKVDMRTLIRAVAAMQLTLIVPAAVFITAVLVAAGDAPQYDLARIAQRIVTGYSATRYSATLFVAGTTLTSAGILAIVVLDMLAN